MKLSPINSYHENTGDSIFNDNDSQRKSDDLNTLNFEDSSISIKSYIDSDVQDKIESLYAEIVTEAKNEPILSLYQRNFEFIYHLVKALIENEAKLKNFIVHLRSTNEEITNKFNKSVELSTTDQQTIVKLRSDVENAWKTAHIANQKEKRTRETVSAMKLEISNLSKLVEQGVGLTMGQEYNLHQIINENEMISEENAKLKEDIDNLKKQLNDLKDVEKQVEIVKNEANIKFQIIEKETSMLRLELQQENRKVEKMTLQIKNLTELLQAKESDILRLQKVIEGNKSELNDSVMKSKELVEVIDKLKNEIDIQTGRIQKFQRENYQITFRNEALIDEQHQFLQKIKTKNSAIETLNNQITNLSKWKEINEKKLKQTEDAVKELTNQNLLKTVETEALIKELENANAKNANENSFVDKLLKEREQKEKKIQSIQNKSRQLKKYIREHEREREFYDKRIKEQYKEIENFESRVKNYENEILQKEDELAKMANKLIEVIEEIKLKESSLAEYDKKLNESRLRLEKTEKMYETIKADRNMNVKELIGVKEEKESIKKQVIMLKNQQTLLATSKQGTEKDLKKVKSDYNSIEKERDYLKIKLNNMQKQLSLSHQVTNNLQIEQKKLLSLLNDADKEAKNSSKQIQILIIERGILGSQLIRRNDEISLLYEKIKLLKFTLQRGESSYSIRLNDLKILKKEILRLRKIIHIQSNEDKIVLKLKNELRHSEKELLNEKAKCKALEHLQETMKIHRWRKVEACDPAKYELIIKVQSLQKSLISKYEETAKLQLQFQEKDKIFFELKKYYSRQQFKEGYYVEKQAVLDKKIIKLKVNQIFLFLFNLPPFETFFTFRVLLLNTICWQAQVV